MASGHLSIEDFFTRLSSLFQSRRNSTHGSVFLTQKRREILSLKLSPQCMSSKSNLTLVSPKTTPTSSPTKAGVPFPDLALSSPLPVLIRASNGKSKENRKDKIKLSTIVQPEELDGFFTKYAEIMKVGTAALKKRDRSGRKKATKAKKKGKGAGGVDGEKK
ncbi:MAG: hypothetical protein Q9213_001660 [Squamulea squamosa]